MTTAVTAVNHPILLVKSFLPSVSRGLLLRGSSHNASLATRTIWSACKARMNRRNGTRRTITCLQFLLQNTLPKPAM